MHKLQQSLIAAVITCGDTARRHQNRIFAGHEGRETYKSDNTPLTVADVRINKFLAEFADFHKLGFIGEEGNGEIDRELMLLVDPIDGTGAFMRGMNTATIIASIMEMDGKYGEPVFSVIHEPLSGRTWIGSRVNRTALLDGNRKASKTIVAGAKKPFRSNICVWPGTSHNLGIVKQGVQNDTTFTNQDLGAFGIAGCLIASGVIDTAVIGSTSAVESAAMQLIVNGAGGVSLDLGGKKLSNYKLGKVGNKDDFELPNGALFASNMEVAETVLQKIKQANA